MWSYLVQRLLRLHASDVLRRIVGRSKLLSSGDCVRAMSLFRRKPKPADSETLTVDGHQLLDSGDPQAAVALFDSAVALDPENALAWFGKGGAHDALAQYEEAIGAYLQSVQFAGENAGLPLYNLGNLYQKQDQLQDAARCFHEATKADPEMADAWINLGRIVDDEGQHAEAVEYYDTALKIVPEDVMAWSNRGNSLRGLQRFEDSLASYQQALQIDEEDIAARIGIGACLMECDRPQEGIAALAAVVRDTDHPLALAEYATALAATGQHADALSCYDRVIDEGMESAEILSNRGECLAALGQPDASLESFERSIEIDSACSAAWFGQARVLVNANRIEEAKPVAQQYWDLIDEAKRSNQAVQAMMVICGVLVE